MGLLLQFVHMVLLLEPHQSKSSMLLVCLLLIIFLGEQSEQENSSVIQKELQQLSLLKQPWCASKEPWEDLWDQRISSETLKLSLDTLRKQKSIVHSISLYLMKVTILLWWACISNSDYMSINLLVPLKDSKKWSSTPSSLHSILLMKYKISTLLLMNQLSELLGTQLRKLLQLDNQLITQWSISLAQFWERLLKTNNSAQSWDKSTILTRSGRHWCLSLKIMDIKPCSMKKLETWWQNVLSPTEEKNMMINTQKVSLHQLASPWKEARNSNLDSWCSPQGTAEIEVQTSTIF